MPSSSGSAYEFFPANRPIPSFKLTAVRTGRVISPRDCAGSVLGLVFHGRETVQAVVDINTAVRPHYPDPVQLIFASVVDLSSVPRMLHRMVRPILEQVYDRAAREIPDGYDPASYIFLLPDWDGKVTRVFGAGDSDRTAAIVVLDASGRLAGSYQGPEPGPATLRLVEKALASP